RRRARSGARTRADRGRHRDQVAGGQRPAAVRARPASRAKAAASGRIRGLRHVRRRRASPRARRSARNRPAVTELRPLLQRLRFAVFDFDGVFTDNRVWVNERGEEMLAFSRSDGLGLRRLDEVGVQYLIVSTEPNPIVGARAVKLNADCVQGVDDKLAVVFERTELAGVALEDTAYVGNDVNDVDCLRAVGLPVVPADAWPEARSLARWVLSLPGGAGCVREFCDGVWEAQRS